MTDELVEMVLRELGDRIKSYGITEENKWFDLKGAVEDDGGHAITTLSISKDGIKITRKIHH